jgi:hypothetical protein
MTMPFVKNSSKSVNGFGITTNGAKKGSLTQMAKLVRRSLLDCSIHRHSQRGHTTYEEGETDCGTPRQD